jgi:hypothetical protein
VREDEFWPALEYRVSRELASLPNHELRYLWCDGFLPEDRFLEGGGPSIRGRVWIAENRQWLWGFRVQLPAAAREVNDWAWLVPPDSASGWLVADPASQSLAIDLRSLRPTDLSG